MPHHFNVPSSILPACIARVVSVNDLANLPGHYKNYNVELECPSAEEIWTLRWKMIRNKFLSVTRKKRGKKTKKERLSAL